MQAAVRASKTLNQILVIVPHSRTQQRGPGRPKLAPARFSQLDEVIDAVDEAAEYVTPEERLIPSFPMANS